MNVTDYIKKLEQQKIELEEEVKDSEKLKYFLDNLDFPVLSFSQLENKLEIYTSDYSQMLECSVVDLQRGFNIHDVSDNFYIKGFEFSALKPIGEFEVRLLLKDEDAEKRKMNVLYEYNSKSGINFPNSFEQLSDFYKSKDLKPSVRAKLKNIIKMSGMLIG